MTTMRRIKRAGRNPSTGAKYDSKSIINWTTKKDGLNPSTGVRNQKLSIRTGFNSSIG